MCWIEPGLKVVDMDINTPSSLVNARVVDLLDDEGSWNWQLFWRVDFLMFCCKNVSHYHS